MTDKEKLSNALKIYANEDMWSYCGGEPFIKGKLYGTGSLSNAFNILPPINGWELAQQTLDEVSENNCKGCVLEKSNKKESPRCKTCSRLYNDNYNSEY